ncbi:MAG: HXXEE domain-containing protein [Eubacterium sp.]
MKNSYLNRWCRKTWLIVSLMISAAMTACIIINWNTWSVSLKLTAAITALIPIHSSEEWYFPGGFYFQYNLFLSASEKADRYPMNRLTDMITVFGTTLMFLAITLISAITGKTVSSGILLGGAAFSALETAFHTYCGIRAYLRYKGKGKSTIYGPGSMTAYFGFLPLGILMLIQAANTTLSRTDGIAALAILAAIAILAFAPEKFFSSPDTEFAFDGNGYYDWYMD